MQMNNVQNVFGNIPDQKMAQNPAFYTGTANFGGQRQPIFRPAYVGNVPLTAVVDQQKWLEKQQKDRNFQQQRERLREFSNTASSQNISTETRIKNMIDKLDKPRIDKQPDVKYTTETVNKTADWRDFNDGQHLYVKPIAFTGWKEVPEAYRTLELAVTRNGAIDIQLLYPILMSSGLSRETLGYIWSLSSCTNPGSLNRDELYVMIGLVAIAQNGYIFSSVDVLHQFSHPPIPKLDLGPSVQMPFPVPTPIPNKSPVATAEAAADDDFDDFQSASVDGKPYHAISSNVGSRLASYNTNVKSQEVINVRPVQPLVDEEFTEFQQANVAESKVAPLPTNASIVELDLMSSQEDKYSVFRQLGTNTEIQVHRNDQKVEEEDDDEEFGDFLGNVKPYDEPIPQLQLPQVVDIPKNTWDRDLLTVSETNSLKSPQSLQSLRSTVEGSPSETLDTTDEFGDFISYPVGGGSASVESQSVSSLEMAIWDTLSVNGGKTSPRADSVPSLELKISDEDAEPDVQTKLQSLLLDRGTTPIPADRYSLFSSEISPQDVDAPHSDWNKCLESCCKLVSNAVNVFNNIVNTKVCEEVIQSEEGSEFIENIAEVYRVACRVASSAANFGLIHDDTTKLVEQIRKEWKNLIRYFEDADIQVEDLRCNEHQLDSDRIAVACGVCLLDVEGDTDQSASYKLSYGGRQYHTTCANFWINCVDSLLPAVPFPRHV